MTSPSSPYGAQSFFEERGRLNSDELAGNGPKPKWDFIANRAPWWGGFWERMNTMLKDRMARTFTRNSFKDMANFTEAVAYVQCVINSRPLTWNSDNRENPHPITPAMFLLASPPEFKTPFEYAPDVARFGPANSSDLKGSIMLKEKYRAQIWSTFRDSYITELRKRREMHATPTDSLLAVNQVVLYKPQGIFRELTPQGKLKWRLARIEKLHHSKRDGRVRSADIRLYDSKHHTTYVLPSQTIQNLAPFEVDLLEAEKRLVANKNPRSSTRLQAQKDSEPELEDF